VLTVIVPFGALNSKARGLAGAPELAETTFLYSLATTAVAVLEVVVLGDGAAIKIPVTPVPADVIVIPVTLPVVAPVGIVMVAVAVGATPPGDVVNETAGAVVYPEPPLVIEVGPPLFTAPAGKLISPAVFT
jgi:hypothetical protein